MGSSAIPFVPGTAEYFAHYDRVREASESPTASSRLHEYRSFIGKRVLDVGCGNGYVLSNYAKEGAETHGTDVTSTALELSSRRFEVAGLRGLFTQGSAEDLPYPGETFDCVCSMGVLHHTPHPARGIDEVFRVLRPGGRLIIMLYHRDSALYRWGLRLRSRFSGRPRAQLVDEVDGVGNPKGEVYSKTEVRDLLSDFEGIQLSIGVLQGWMLLPRGGRLVPDLFLRPFASRFGWFLYAKANRPR